jgi:hypothetical protein
MAVQRWDIGVAEGEEEFAIHIPRNNRERRARLPGCFCCAGWRGDGVGRRGARTPTTRSRLQAFSFCFRRSSREARNGQRLRAIT